MLWQIPCGLVVPDSQWQVGHRFAVLRARAPMQVLQTSMVLWAGEDLSHSVMNH
jgi:hypothetical protein